MYRDNLLPPVTIFFGYARSKITIDDIRKKCDQYMKVKDDEKEKYEQFWKINYYVAGSYTERRDFEMLNQEMSKHDNLSTANRLFYLALPPSVFESVTVNIRNTCMALQ